MLTNSVIIGVNAGINLTGNLDGIVIIGDNIEDLSHNQKNVMFLGERVAIGETLMGIPINLKQVLEDYIFKKPLEIVKDEDQFKNLIK